MLKFKPVLSRKLVLSITAGALVTASVIGAGTFAWFTYNGTAKLEASFHTGTMSNIVFGENDAAMYNFLPSHKNSLDAMQKLELGLATVTEAADKNAVFKTWFEENTNAFKYFDVNSVPKKPQTFNEAKIGLITNPFSNNTGDDGVQRFWQLTPGSLIEAGFHMDAHAHDSAPIYFRVKPASLVAYTDNETPQPVWGLQQAMTATIQLKTSETAEGESEPTYVNLTTDLILGEDGYYYCSVPLMSGTKGDNGTSYEVSQADIKLYAYVSGKNDLKFEDTAIKFAGANKIEFIQATNNAVYLVDGWAEIAAEDFFVPYVNTDIYVKYLEDWARQQQPEQP